MKKFNGPVCCAITFGALADPIRKQLRLQGLRAPREMVKAFQRCADAITLLALHNLLPDGETHKARVRLIKQIRVRVKMLKE